MSKIDKIIQIIDNGNRTIVGLSESGVMYLWDGNWEHYAESPYREITKIELAEELAAKSPVVDNSACEVNETGMLDVCKDSPHHEKLAKYTDLLQRELDRKDD